MIKAVLFDFDHTLYDREKTILGTAPELYRRLAEYVKPEVTAEQFSKALLAAEMSENGYYGAGYQGVCNELDRMGIFAVKPTKDQYCAEFYPCMSEHISMYEDSYQVLRRLKEMGYKVALVTNGSCKAQRMKLSYTDVPQYMDEIIISEEVGEQKPHPKPFLAMCDRLGIRTDEALYVGDNVISDICGARGAGLIPVWKPFARTWPEQIAPPPYTIDRLSELLNIIKEL